MLAAWMLYATLVTLLAAVAARSLEEILDLYGRPVRWAWVGALTVSLGLPILALNLGSAPLDAVIGWMATLAGTGGDAPGVIDLGAPAFAAAAGAGAKPGWMATLSALETPLVVGWCVASAALLARLALGAWRFRRERTSWRRTGAEGIPVYVSEETGPAVAGLLRPAVVMPRWMEELAPEARAAALRHEREHLRAGDHRLRWLALLVTALVPWNAAAWWILHRLRRAIEVDCDRRVVTGGVDRRTYGRLLVDAGRRQTRHAFPAAALWERVSDLEHRVESLLAARPRHRGLRAVGLAVLAGATLAVACETPVPIGDTNTGAASQSSESVLPTGASEHVPASGSAAASDKPTFIPYDVPPRLTNAKEVRTRLQEVYPADLKDAGVGGEVVLWMHVDEDGQVIRTRVQESSGKPALDAAARQVAETMSFRPAMNRDRPTAVWVQQKIVFRAGSTAAVERGGEGGAGGGIRLEITPSAGGPDDAATSPTGAVDGVPLVLVDGIRVDDGVLRELDTNEIEKIEVVKGEAAERFYGAEGAGGVIQITTKRGGTG